ncbi:hypothetical protein [Devosia sp. FKR38]|uniref:hypothetical protein n=1 Tax=Devosia sp. FKR38 TaxID=2562312 RepID=UPI0010C06104|nr:hypothetical protein [Devosia sp. FKR38]
MTRTEKGKGERSDRLNLLSVGFVLALCVPVSAADACATPIGNRDRAEINRLNFDPVAPLQTRIAAPTSEVVAAFSQMAGKEATPHQPDTGQLQRLTQALASLPPLHRQMLEHHLRHLSFIDTDGRGTGLTAAVGDGDYPVFDITLRAGILDESLSDFLTAKERQLFLEDGSGTTVSVNAPGDALRYVLLHEASHVVDHVLGLSSELAPELARGIWMDRRDLSAPWSEQAIAGTAYRGGEPMPARQAVALYEALSHTPFPSLYATAAAPEDFAELVAWRELSLASPPSALEFVVQDGQGHQLYSVKPLQSGAVRQRMEALGDLLARCAKMIDLPS